MMFSQPCSAVESEILLRLAKRQGAVFHATAPYLSSAVAQETKQEQPQPAGRKAIVFTTAEDHREMQKQIGIT